MASFPAKNMFGEGIGFRGHLLGMKNYAGKEAPTATIRKHYRVWYVGCGVKHPGFEDKCHNQSIQRASRKNCVVKRSCPEMCIAGCI